MNKNSQKLITMFNTGGKYGENSSKNVKSVHSDNGGYSEEQLNTNKQLHKQWDPTGGYNILGWIFSKNWGNGAKGEENEYYKAYLGLPNKVPGLKPGSETEWDDYIEKQKKDNGELASDFYGTTPRMDENIQVIADTLNLGNIYRNYDKYSNIGLPSKEYIKGIYDQGKKLMDNPGKWVQIEEAKAIKQKYDKELEESDPLGMLASFGAKWNPEDNTIQVHDTYDFSQLARWATGIPERPREMKIRSKIQFDPKKGSKLLRNDLEQFNSGYSKPITK